MSKNFGPPMTLANMRMNGVRRSSRHVKQIAKDAYGFVELVRLVRANLMHTEKTPLDSEIPRRPRRSTHASSNSP
jgi:hypothetical protein